MIQIDARIYICIEKSYESFFFLTTIRRCLIKYKKIKELEDISVMNT